MATVGSSLSSKRLSLTQIIINILGALLFFPFISNFAGIITLTSADLPRQIANAHSVFNVAVSLIMLPLVGILAPLANEDFTWRGH